MGNPPKRGWSLYRRGSTVFHIPRLCLQCDPNTITIPGVLFLQSDSITTFIPGVLSGRHVVEFAERAHLL